MTIYDVTDEKFKKYGRIVQNIDFSQLVEVINEKTPETPDNPGGDNPNTPEVLGAKRDILTPDQGQVLGVHRAPKTSDASKALLWMLVMGGSGIGAELTGKHEVPVIAPERIWLVFAYGKVRLRAGQ